MVLEQVEGMVLGFFIGGGSGASIMCGAGAGIRSVFGAVIGSGSGASGVECGSGACIVRCSLAGRGSPAGFCMVLGSI